MEFVRVKSFTDKSFSEKKSKFKDETLVSMTSYVYSEEDQVLSVGLSNGKLMQYRKKGFEQKNLLSSKEFEIVRFFDVLGGHKGEIRCLCYEYIKGARYLITGSSDRNIKIWENDPKAKQVVQTLVGHNGSILALKYARSSDTIFSASNDKTLKIWKQEDGREFLFHPWYVVFQVIYDFSMKKMINYQAYLTCFLVRENEMLTVFSGDTEGSLHIIKQEEPWKANSTFMIEKSYFNFHRLHVIQIMNVEKDNSLFSIGFDQKILGFEELAGKQFFAYKNPHKCLFTSIDWNPMYQELLASDEQGRIYFINVQTDKQVQEYKLYDCRINSIKLIGREFDQLLIFTDGFVDVLRMKRGIKAGNLLDAHKGPIVGLLVIELPILRKQKEPPKLISASLDNTIRTWDPKDMSCLSTLENNDPSEIAAIHYLKNANLLVTGHDNGDVKLWNADLGSYLVVDQTNPAMRHLNMVCCLASHTFNTGQGGETNEFLFSAGYDGKVNVWEIFEKRAFGNSITSSNIVPQLKHSIVANRNAVANSIGDEILCLLFDANSNCIIAAGNQREVYLIEMFTYEHKAVFRGHRDSINCLAMDGNILFSGSDDKTIRLWDTVNPQFLTLIEAHEHGVKDLLVIDDSGYLVSCATEAIHVWDYPKKLLVTKFQKPETLKCLAYVAEDQCLFVGSEENNIYNYSMAEFNELQKLDRAETRLKQGKPAQAKLPKKTYLVVNDGLEVASNYDFKERKEDLSPKQRRNDSPVRLDQLKDNEFLRQLEEKNQQILQEFAK